MRRLPAVFLALVLSWSALGQTLTNTYGTYFGGTGDKNAAVAVAVDPSGNVIVAGYTTSLTLPGTANAFQPTKATGYADNQNVYVAKFDPTGRSLIWATFLGGDTKDTPVALAVDSQGGIYVVGTTESSNFPASASIFCVPPAGFDFSVAFQQECSVESAPNAATGFLAKLSSDGHSLLYSVGFGDNQHGTWLPSALAVDSQGEAYVGAVGPGVSEGLFLFKVNASGTGLTYGAFLGGGSLALAAQVSSLVTDSLGNCYIAGTANINLPTSPNALQNSDLTPNTGNSFVLEVNATGSQLVYGTWFGAKYAATSISSMAVIPGGSIYFSGITTATTFQATSGAYENTPSQGFIAKLTPGMPVLDAFSYLPSSVPVVSGSIVNGSPLPEVVFGNQPQAVYASFTVGPTGSKGFELAELDPQTLALLSSYTAPGTGFTTTSAALAPTNSVWLVGSVGSGSLGSLISANAYQTTPQSTGTSAVLIQLTDIAADTISPSANSLSFQWQTGSAVPAPQGVSVSGVVATAFTDSASGGGWLSVSPGTGTTPATLSVAINPTGLNPGTYTGTITITAPTATNSPQTISVTLTVTVPLTGGQGPPQIGGTVCANSTLSGVYYYLLSGDLLSGNQFYPYIELGKLVANGQGAVSGSSHASIGGSISANTLSGTYSVQSSCTGSMALSLNSQPPSSLTFQVTNGGQGAVVAFSSPNGVVAGRAYRQTAAAGTIQCATASLSGSYAYLLTGVAYTSGNGYYYSQAGSATGDGLGNMTVAGMVNVNGSTLSTTGQGLYSVASDCSGTASVKNQSGTANYFIAVAEDGQVVLFMESDSGYTVGGVADPTFVTPQSAVVNGASFYPGALSPGAIFSVFGKGLQQSAASGQVLVNGESAPVFFANGSQVNAQIPYDAPTNRPVSLSLSSAGESSNTVLVSLQQGAPGIFTSPGNRAVVENADYSVNSPSNPTHAGDFVTVYLTGGGSVSPAVLTGVPAPSMPLSYVSAANSVSIGTLPAFVYFLGLTPGFEGLYQANVQVPALAPGDYAVVVTVAGVTSNGPLISIR